MAEILIGNIRGPKGDVGTSLKILGYYDTEQELYDSVPYPEVGIAYGVKNGETYDIYIYTELNGWVNNGAFQPDINEQTPNYDEATELVTLSSGEAIKIAFGKIAKAVKDLISHLGNKSNPHEVTAKQIGAFQNLGFLGDYDTVFDAAKLPNPAGYTFFAVQGYPLFFAEDSAFPGNEVQYLVFTDTPHAGERRTVIAYDYSENNIVKVRKIFRNEWLSDDWYSMTPELPVSEIAQLREDVDRIAQMTGVQL